MKKKVVSFVKFLFRVVSNAKEPMYVYIGWPLDDFRSPKYSVSCVFWVGKKRVNV